MGRTTGLKTDDLCTIGPEFFAAAVVYGRYAAVGDDRFSAAERGLEAAVSGLGLADQGQEHEKKQDELVAAGDVEERGGQWSGAVGKESKGMEVEEEGEGMSRWTCKTCASIFRSLEQQRSHFSSDFHRLNIKRKVHGKSVLSEEEFEVLAKGQKQHEDDDVSSISGSGEENSDDEHVVQCRVNRSAHISFLLQNSGQVVSLWRSVLLTDKECLPGEKGYVESEVSSVSEQELLRRLMLTKSSDSKQVWVIFLSIGGHFAALVANIAGGQILEHQTFHRYVVRAKAGGRQSTKDDTGRAPKSAGASLRRHNEKALQKDIRDLLTTWRDHLQKASLIFVHAPSSNGQTLFGGENSLLRRNDPRVRNIPFTTRRPTFREARRVFGVLTSLAYRGDANMQVPSKVENRESLEEKLPETVTARNEKKPGQVSDSGGRENKAGEPVETADRKSLSALHEASQAGNTDLVMELLKSGADPTVKECSGRTPYALAVSKETRNVYRRFMAKHPDMWDWRAANVPSALTDEMEAAQSSKQAEKDSKRKAKLKELKKQKKAQEKAKQAEANAAELAAATVAHVRYGESSKFNKLASAAMTAKQNPRALEEALLKAQAREREIRAAAAEMRLRASGGGSASVQDPCSCCGNSLSGKVPFTRYSYRYCSTTCVQVHMEMLDG